MAGKKGMRLRSWGSLRRLPSGRWQASYIGNDLARHTAPTTYTSRMDAEAWLAAERRLIERDEWIAPKARIEINRAKSKTLGDYATDWLATRNISPRTKIEYQSKYTNLIAPKLGTVALSALNSERIRSWYAGLDATYQRRNAHAYALLHAVCGTAVTDGLLASNPCHIERAMNPQRKKEPTILTVPEVAALADAITPQFRAFVLIAAWCGLRLGEITELRRHDIGAGCEVITIARAVTRTPGTLTVKTTKSGKVRTVVVPPHIRADVKHHLDVHTGKAADALLFPGSNGKHINDTMLRRKHFHPALKAIGREGTRVHDLRHFAGTQAARVGNLVETMGRLGHSTPHASLFYQHQVSGRDAEVAAALSELAQVGHSTA